MNEWRRKKEATKKKRKRKFLPICQDKDEREEENISFSLLFWNLTNFFFAQKITTIFDTIELISKIYTYICLFNKIYSNN